MKKIKRVLAFMLVAMIAFSLLPVSAFASELEDLRVVTIEQTWSKTTFHCNGNDGGSGGGRVKPSVGSYGGNDKVQIWLVIEEIIGSTKWNLIDVQDKDGNSLTMPECPKCGRTEWVSFSNNSGTPNGKNIQMNHPAIGEQEENGSYMLEVYRFYFDATEDDYVAVPDEVIFYDEVNDLEVYYVYEEPGEDDVIVIDGVTYSYKYYDGAELTDTSDVDGYIFTINLYYDPVEEIPETAAYTVEHYYRFTPLVGEVVTSPAQTYDGQGATVDVDTKVDFSDSWKVFAYDGKDYGYTDNSGSITVTKDGENVIRVYYDLRETAPVIETAAYTVEHYYRFTPLVGEVITSPAQTYDGQGATVDVNTKVDFNDNWKVLDYDGKTYGYTNNSGSIIVTKIDENVIKVYYDLRETAPVAETAAYTVIHNYYYYPLVGDMVANENVSYGQGGTAVIGDTVNYDSNWETINYGGRDYTLNGNTASIVIDENADNNVFVINYVLEEQEENSSTPPPPPPAEYYYSVVVRIHTRDSADAEYAQYSSTPFGGSRLTGSQYSYADIANALTIGENSYTFTSNTDNLSGTSYTANDVVYIDLYYDLATDEPEVTPSPEPTPTPNPNPGEDEDFEEEEEPPRADLNAPDPIKENEDEEFDPEEEPPTAELPFTGGFALGSLAFLGAGLMGFGLILGKKK